MGELFSRFNAGEIIGLISVLAGCTVAITAIVCAHWWKLRQAELDASLKAEMLRQGKSVDEIERLLRATSVPGEPVEEKDCDITDEVFLVRRMGDAGYDGDAIGRLVALYKTAPPDSLQREARLMHEMVRQGQEIDQIEEVIRDARPTFPAPLAR